jgi:hypothetical protein
MKITDEMKPFVKENMTREDYRILGQYLMQKKIDGIKSKFGRLFKK